MQIKRIPPPALRPFVKSMWASDQTGEIWPVEFDREHSLPTGEMHLVFRLSAQPIHLFDDDDDAAGRSFGHAVVGGMRSGFYVRDISKPVAGAGVQLLPGAAELLFGAPADEFAEKHTLLEDLWGRSTNLAREQLLDAPSLSAQLDVLESILTARVPAVRGLHPAVAQALEQFWTTSDVREVVQSSGYSHRQFIALFKRAVGLTPKLYCRVLRFQKVLGRLAAGSADSWVDLAIEAGYSDQPHFSREFREFTGVTPEQYRKASPAFPYHLPVLPGRS